jgi:hypothetical protein
MTVLKTVGIVALILYIAYLAVVLGKPELRRRRAIRAIKSRYAAQLA